jgi:RNA polymerase sigma-70 factor (ECF subfamily)
MTKMPRFDRAADASSGPVGAADIARDPDAFEAFYREHVDALQRFIARRVATPEAAADLTADVFLAAIEAAASYDPGCGPAKAWLFGIARHRIADSYRNAARESRATAAVLGSELLDADDLSRIHDRLDAEAAARDLYQRLDTIPEPERAVLELVALDELSVVEAAAALKITQVAARVRLHRARRRLAQAVADPSTRPAGRLEMLVTEPRG